MATAFSRYPLEGGVKYIYDDDTTGDDYGEANWVFDPDVSGLSAVDVKYWKWDGSAVVEMSAAEKAAVDSFESDPTNANDSGLFGTTSGTVFTTTTDTYLPIPGFSLTPPRGNYFAIMTCVVTFSEGDVADMKLVLDDVDLTGSELRVGDDSVQGARLPVTLQGGFITDGTKEVECHVKLDAPLGSMTVRDKCLTLIAVGG